MKAFIFDLDGTLIDSLEDLADAVNLMLKERGYPQQPLKVFPQYIGEGVHKLVERALPHDGRARIDECVADYQRHYGVTWDHKTKPYEGILEALQELREYGYKIGVLSNKPHEFTLKCCGHFFPDGTFDIVLGARDDVPRKPDPAGALEIAQAFEVEPAECFYVGDSGIDMQTARNAGMSGIGVLWGFRDEAELRENRARFIVAKPADLVIFAE
jgi:phosphoglycolate phosphatase